MHKSMPLQLSYCSTHMQIRYKNVFKNIFFFLEIQKLQIYLLIIIIFISYSLSLHVNKMKTSIMNAYYF